MKNSKQIRRRTLAAVAALLISLTTLTPRTAASNAAEAQSRTAAAETSVRAAYRTVPVYIDGVRLGRDAYIIENGVTYLPLRTLAEQLLPGASVRWDSKNNRAEVRTGKLVLTAAPGQSYIIANGRYLSLSGLHPAAVTLTDGVTYVPLRTAVRGMGGTVTWNAARGCVEIASGSGTITAGDAYYNKDTLYWLSRIIYAEAGNQSLRGQLAVGSVVMNRVKHGQFPNTVYGVIFDRKWGVQFTPVANGAIYRTPSEQSIIAAKLVLDGCRISEQALYFLDPRIASSFWIVENRQALFSIGCHDFYS